MNNPSLRFQRITFGNGDRGRELIEIDSGEVHVWGFLLDVDTAHLSSAIHYLSREERAKGDRLVSERQRRQFVAAHAMLRDLLSRYCGQNPGEVMIQKTPMGKPFLNDGSAIRFNLTHSFDRALIALAKNREVGVDLEIIRPRVDVTGIADRFLSSKDQAFIGSGDPRQRSERFLKIWVAREAVSKAQGKGISFPLHRDYVEFASDEEQGYLIGGDGGVDGTGLPFRFLVLETGWVGAVAAEGTNWTVTYRSFGES